jgi:endogenous inhibitor of DNA gyrase (YacG/DUF329 family)
MALFTCDHCGASFKQSPAQRKGPRCFCKRACYTAWQHEQMKVVCEVCGVTFSANTSQKRRFCSRKCGGVWASAHRHKEHAPVWKGGIPERPCEECGKVHQPKTYPSQARKRFFCSPQCYAVWMSKHRTGSNAPYWKGGWSGRRYYGPNWLAQSRATRARDSYRCKGCGKTQKQNGRPLDVHHIRPFREFGYIRDTNDNYLAANDLTNLISLCKQCHGLAEANKIAIQPYLM